MLTLATYSQDTLFPVQKPYETLFTRAHTDCGANAKGGQGFQPGNTCGKKDGAPSSEKPVSDKPKSTETDEKTPTKDTYSQKYADEINAYLKSNEAIEAWEKYADRFGAKEPFDPKTIPEFAVNEFGLLRPTGEFKDQRDGSKLNRLLQIKTCMKLAEKLTPRVSSDDLTQFAADNPKTEAKKGDAFGVAQMFVSGWNYDSSDLASVAVQTRAVEKLGIEDAHRPSWKEFRWGGEEGLKKYLGTGVNQKVVDAVVDSVYESTQEKLKEAGVENITVYRGKKGETPDEKGNRASTRNDTVKANPLSPYSTSLSQAEKFTRNDDETHGTIVGGVILRARVFSIPSTGMGTTVESEVVVINDSSQKMRVMSYKHKRKFGDNDAYIYDTSDLSERFWGAQ